MIIRITSIPDIPILDSIPLDIKKDLVGLFMQGRSGYVMPAEHAKEGLVAEVVLDIYSRTLAPDNLYHFIPTINVMGAAEDAQKNELFAELFMELLNKGEGLCLSYNEAEIITL